MSVRNVFVSLLAISGLLLLGACGGGSGTSPPLQCRRPAEHLAIAISTERTFFPSLALIPPERLRNGWHLPANGDRWQWKGRDHGRLG